MKVTSRDYDALLTRWMGEAHREHTHTVWEGSRRGQHGSILYLLLLWLVRAILRAR